MNIIGRRKIWYSLSLIMIVPGVISLALFGLRLGIDFNSGELSVVRGSVSAQTVSSAAAGLGLRDVRVTVTGSN